MLKRIIVAAIYLPFFILVLFFLPTWCSAVLASLLAIVAAWELLHNTGLSRGFPLWLSVIAAACASPKRLAASSFIGIVLCPMLPLQTDT